MTIVIVGDRTAGAGLVRFLLLSRRSVLNQLQQSGNQADIRELNAACAFLARFIQRERKPTDAARSSRYRYGRDTPRLESFRGCVHRRLFIVRAALMRSSELGTVDRIESARTQGTLGGDGILSAA